MNETVQVHTAVTTGGGTNTYGERATQASSRSVKCYLSPFETAEQTPASREVTPSWSIYADDVDIASDDKITLPGGNDKLVIDRVETYFDDKGKLYQVVTV
jgi:hypothetical protein